MDDGVDKFIGCGWQTVYKLKFKMYRNNYNTHTGFAASQPYHSQYRNTASIGFGQRAPLYPIGPTLTQPQFKPMQRGLSPSPYLSREGMKPPSYENRYLQRAQSLNTQLNLTYEQREKRLIEQNQRQIEQELKRREQLRISYEREIKALTVKLNRNLEKKQKLNDEISSLDQNHQIINQKLLQMRPPEKKTDNLEHIDRKQQQLIILKNRLMTSMRETQIELNKKQEEEDKYWEEQVADKEKILFQLEQKLRDKRLQLHAEKQKSLERPDFLSIEEEVRAAKHQQFMEEYEDLERKLKNMTEQREQKNNEIKDTIELKKPQLHNNNVRMEEMKRQEINLRVRVKELERVSEEMQAANQNLMKDLQRKEAMVTKYELDIHDLTEKKKHAEAEVSEMLENARSRDASSLSKNLSDIISKINDQIRTEQAKGARLKNAYQKLYELLCSATSKNIHQTFNETLLT